jgi:hypothetical protein
MTSEQWVLWIFAVFCILLLAIMQWAKKLPTTSELQDLAAIINSRGGNITVLAGFSILFFVSSIRFSYWIISQARDGKLTVVEGLAMATFSWMTGSAFGGAFTSMVKAMSGENTKARSTDISNGNGNGNNDYSTVSQVTTTTSKTSTPETIIQTTATPKENV